MWVGSVLLDFGLGGSKLDLLRLSYWTGFGWGAVRWDGMSLGCAEYRAGSGQDALSRAGLNYGGFGRVTLGWLGMG